MRRPISCPIAERLRGAPFVTAVVLLAVAGITVSLVPQAAAAAAGYRSSLTRYPYVSEVVGNSATVDWATDRSSITGSASWGQVINDLCTPTHTAPASRIAMTVGTRSEYKWTSALIFPNSGSFCYRVQLGAVDLLGTDPSPRVQTAPSPGSAFSFAVLGDWGAGTTNEAAVLARIAESPASFVVTTGDNEQNSGTDTQYGDLGQGNVFPTRYLPRLGSRPIFAGQGNHGFTTNLPYLQNFPAPLGAQASGGRNVQESYCCISTMSSSHAYASSWYAFDWGSARFYVLEAAWADGQGGYQGDFLAHWNGPVAGCAPCGAELQWLKSDLAAHPSTPIKFAFLHYPLYSDSSSQPSDTYLSGSTRLEGLLADNGVRIVFDGHAHQYERNYPQIAGRSLVSYVTGGGGAALGTIAKCSAFDAYAVGSGSSCRAPKPTSSSQVYEFLLVTVEANRVTVSPTDATGRVFDRQTYDYASSPSIVIDSAPPAMTNATSATVAFHSTSTTVASFSCALDGAPASACSNPVTYSGLPAGRHTVSVSAAGAAPGQADWTVDLSPPTVPGALSATAVSPAQVDIRWAPSTDDNVVASYLVYRDGESVATTAGPSYTDTRVLPSTTYQYAVSARDGADNLSALSPPVAVTTPAPAPGPVLVQSARSGTTTVTLPAASRVGDLLVLTAGVFTGSTQRITAVTDGTNQWTKVGSFSVSGSYSDGEMWYTALAAPVSTIRVTTGASAVALQVMEFGGISSPAPLHASKGSAANSQRADSGPASPLATSELAVGFIAGHGNSQAISVTSSGFALQPQQTTTSPSKVSVVSGYAVTASTSALSFTGTFPASMFWSAGIALFRLNA